MAYTFENARYEALELFMEKELINQFISDLEGIFDELWKIDIPSPTVPEYIEHHEQVQKIMKHVQGLSQRWVNMANEAKTEFFKNYGILEWLEPSKYYAEPWTYVSNDTTINGRTYDIVRNIETDEYRYTIV